VAALSGCIERRISITSEPQGALVHLNDKEVGRTPLVVPFTYYGVYDVRLTLDGYEPLWTSREAKGAWWELPGPDLVAEAVSDRTVQIDWHFDLEPTLLSEEQPLKDRAWQMRAMVDQIRPSRDTVPAGGD
jgi:hypothetical protein